MLVINRNFSKNKTKRQNTKGDESLRQILWVMEKRAATGSSGINIHQAGLLAVPE